MRTKKGWRGYNFSRPIDGNMIPQRVQNLVIRGYCQSNGLEYLLSATEYSMDGSYMILGTVLDELAKIEGIVFYSVHMLPANAEARRDLYDKILNQGSGLRFALEELKITQNADIPLIEDLMIAKDISSGFAQTRTNTKSENLEVDYAVDPTVMIPRAEIGCLKRRASENPRKRSRLCTHLSINDKLHEMLIVHEAGVYVRPHKHLTKAESLHVIEGTARLVLFNDEGKVNGMHDLGPYAEGGIFYYRISEPIFHCLLITSPIFVFHEVTIGPFAREETEFPEWAPAPDDIKGQKEFMSELVRRADEFIGIGGMGG